MRLIFDTYWPLLLLLVIPYLWRVQTKTLADLSPKHLQLAGVVRSVIIALITVSLMQPVLYRSGAWESIVYLLAVSDSVSPPAIQSAMQWIQQPTNLGHPDHSTFVPFAANSTVLEPLDQLTLVDV